MIPTEIIDMSAFDQFVALWGSDATEIIQEIVGIFLDNAPQLLADMGTALDAGDMRELRRLAHTLKSNSATVGARSFSERCQALEDAARHGDIERAHWLLEQIDDAFPAVRDRLSVVTQTFRAFP